MKKEKSSSGKNFKSEKDFEAKQVRIMKYQIEGKRVGGTCRAIITLC